MKTLLCFTLFALGFTHAAPTDAELLSIVKDRTKLERLTPKSKNISERFAGLCAIDSLLAKKAMEASPHGLASIHIFANTTAALPYFDPWGKFPEGSLLLKENLSAVQLLGSILVLISLAMNALSSLEHSTLQDTIQNPPA